MSVHLCLHVPINPKAAIHYVIVPKLIDSNSFSSVSLNRCPSAGAWRP